MFNKKIEVRIDKDALQVIRDAKEKDIVVVRVGSSEVFPNKEMIDRTAELIHDHIPKPKCGLIVVPYFISMHNLKFEGGD